MSTLSRGVIRLSSSSRIARNKIFLERALACWFAGVMWRMKNAQIVHKAEVKGVSCTRLISMHLFCFSLPSLRRSNGDRGSPRVCRRKRVDAFLILGHFATFFFVLGRLHLVH